MTISREVWNGTDRKNCGGPVRIARLCWNAPAVFQTTTSPLQSHINEVNKDTMLCIFHSDIAKAAYSSYREFATLRLLLPVPEEEDEDDEEEDDEEEDVCRYSS